MASTCWDLNWELRGSSCGEERELEREKETYRNEGSDLAEIDPYQPSIAELLICAVSHPPSASCEVRRGLAKWMLG
ncbi:hypothetical protein AOLI_G00302740 [Acnodon oligacanthus]